MVGGIRLRSVESMNTTHSFSAPSTSSTPGAADRPPLPWLLILGLGAVALVRPLLHITGLSSAPGVAAGAVAVSATLVISVIWIAVVVLARVQRPLLTLVLAGLTYAVLSMLLSAVLSPLLDGELQGPFAHPIAIPAVLIVNLIWGAITGAVAAGLRRVIDQRPSRR